jgi:hypothetical protein
VHKKMQNCWNIQVPIAAACKSPRQGSQWCISLHCSFKSWWQMCLLQKLYLLKKPLSICGHKHNVRIWLTIRSACKDCRPKSGCFVFYGNKQRLDHPILQNALRRV